MPPPAYVGRHRRVRVPGAATLVTAVAVVILSLTAVVAGAVAFTGASAPPGYVEGLGNAPPSTPPPTATTGSPEPPATSAPPSPPPPTTPTPDRPSPTPEPEEPDPVDEITALEDEVAALTNAERAAAGCDPLRTDERLRTAARLHSEDMAAHDYFSHTGRDGSHPGERAARAGYDGWGGENIAYGYRTPQDVVEGWMGSPGHRANILNCGFVAIGLGLAYDRNGRAYWTQEFGYR